jgi:hypothetical protein
MIIFKPYFEYSYLCGTLDLNGRQWCVAVFGYCQLTEEFFSWSAGVWRERKYIPCYISCLKLIQICMFILFVLACLTVCLFVFFPIYSNEWNLYEFYKFEYGFKGIHSDRWYDNMDINLWKFLPNFSKHVCHFIKPFSKWFAVTQI